MPTSGSGVKKDITFIIGDSRSRKNVTRIRKHARHAAKRFKDRSDTSSHDSATTPTASANSPSHHCDADGASPRSEDLTGELTRFRDGQIQCEDMSTLYYPDSSNSHTTEPPTARENHESCLGDPISLLGSHLSQPGLSFLAPFDQNNYGDRTLPLPGARGRENGTYQFLDRPEPWFISDSRNPFATSDKDGEEESPVTTIMRTSPVESTITKFRGLPKNETLDGRKIGQAVPFRVGSGFPVGSHSVHHHAHGKSMVETKHKLRKSQQEALNAQWRLGAAPAAALALSQEHTSFERVLFQTTAFYTGKFEALWLPMLRKDQLSFDVQSEIEMFNETTLTAGALLTAGKPQLASEVIGNMLPFLEHLLHSNHPQLYYLVATLSLETNLSPLGQLRVHLKQHMARLARRTLGSDHPITVLLRLVIPSEQRARLCESVQKQIQHLHLSTFGPDAYQTLGHSFFLARILSQLGKYDDALEILAALIPKWERMYGMNSLIAVYGMIDKANVYLASGQPSIRAEFIISDTLRRIQVISMAAEEAKERIIEAEAQIVATTIAFGRMGALKTLGRLHAMRQNYGAALQAYGQAIELGESALGPDSPAVELARANLETTRLMDPKNSADLFSLLSDKSQRPIPANQNVQTVLGPVKTTRQGDIGASHFLQIPSYGGVVYGFAELPSCSSRLSHVTAGEEKRL